MPEQPPVMHCGYSDKTPEELKKDGWELVTSFRANDSGHWDSACAKVDEIKENDWWDVVLALSPEEDELARKAGVT